MTLPHLMVIGMDNRLLSIVRKPSQPLIAVVVGIGGFLFVALGAFPGTFTPDSVHMVWQGEGAAPTSNWHPPVAVRLWAGITGLFGGPEAIFLIQALLYGIGVWMLTSSVRNLGSQFSIALLLLSPPMAAIPVSVWKDSQLALLLLVLLGLQARCQSLGATRSRVHYPTLVLSILMVALRFNAFPLAAMGLLLALPPPKRQPLLRTFSMALVAGALLAATMHLFIGNSIVDLRLSPEDTSQAWDLAAVAVEARDADLIPEEVRRRPACTLDELADQYNPVTSDRLIWPEDACFDLTLPEEYQEQAELLEADAQFREIPLDAWLSRIAKHPFAYLSHRFDVALRGLGILGAPYGAFAIEHAPSAATIIDTGERGPLWGQLSSYLLWSLRNLPLIWDPWFYLVATTIFAFRRRHTEAGIALGILAVGSGLFAAMTLIIAPATDLRYMYPLIVVGIYSVAATGASLNEKSH